MERETRLELATLALARRCSTTELLPLSKKTAVFKVVERNVPLFLPLCPEALFFTVVNIYLELGKRRRALIMRVDRKWRIVKQCACADKYHIDLLRKTVVPRGNYDNKILLPRLVPTPRHLSVCTDFCSA